MKKRYKLVKPCISVDDVKNYHAVIVRNDSYWFEDDSGWVLVGDSGTPMCNPDLHIANDMLKVFSKASGFSLKVKFHEVVLIPVDINDWDYVEL